MSQRKEKLQNRSAAMLNRIGHPKFPLVLAILLFSMAVYLVFTYLFAIKMISTVIPSLEVAYYSFKYACQNLLSELSSLKVLLYLPGALILLLLMLRMLLAPARIVLDLIKTAWLISSLEIVGQLGQNIVLFRSDRPYAFTAGLLSRKIYISNWVTKQLSKPEIEAVIIHESSHIQNHDNLKLLLARLLHYMLPSSKITASLIDSMNIQIEQRCDDAVIQSQKSRTYLRTAWKKFARHGALSNGLMMLNNFALVGRDMRSMKGSRLTRKAALIEFLKLSVFATFLILLAVRPPLEVHGAEQGEVICVTHSTNLSSEEAYSSQELLFSPMIINFSPK